MKLRSSFFYRLNNNEVFRYIDEDKKSIHIVNKESDVIENQLFDKFKFVDTKASNFFPESEKFDLIVITDLIEFVDNIFDLLITSKKHLNENGRIVITSINPRWYFIIKINEFFNLKKSSSIKSYIYPKKIKGTIEAGGLEILNSYNKQIIPFNFLGIGKLLNIFLEVLLCPFGLGLKTYFVCRPKINKEKIYTKSLIVPAKNEEKNLPILFEELEKLEMSLEIILIYANSEDNTEIASYQIEEKYKKHKNLDVTVYKQTQNGKANAVFEALEYTNNDVIAIIDSDISVEPFELKNFYKIIDLGNADFVNGSRLISGLESGSMRFLNILGNRFFQFIINLIISQNISDSLCGTKVFKRENINFLKKWQKKTHQSDPFGDFDLLMSAAYSGQKIVEYPIYYRSRIYGKTQISRFRDGFKLLKYIVRTFFLFKTSYYSK